MTEPNTTAWRFQAWASFVLASTITSLGVLYLPVDRWTKGFLAMGLLFTVGSCFSLAKTLRDDHDARRVAPPREERSGHPFRAAAPR